jgi:hypothetical protein
MEALQSQINSLSAKIDALNTVVERISAQITDVLVRRNDASESGVYTMGPSTFHAYSSRPQRESEMVHKDVLIDSHYMDGHQSEHTHSPEVQIQRLTAQLTAAYNRIAALEEQLLSQRVTH